MEGDLRYRNRGNPALLDLIDIPQGRALDCGCGPGDNARLLKSRGWQVTGVTIDPLELAAARTECDHVELADLTAGLPFALDGEYGLVLLSHILEHLADPTPLLLEARRVLAPGGRILVALPNVLHYRQRAQFLRGRFEYTETGLMDSTHLRFYTVDSARRLIEDNGLRIVAASATGGLPWWRTRESLPQDLVRRWDRRVLGRWPNMFAWQSLFLAAPHPVDTTNDPVGRRVAPPAHTFMAATTGVRTPAQREPLPAPAQDEVAAVLERYRKP